jgi:hypothetical protein
MYCNCLRYIDHTYNYVNTHLKGIVIVLVISTTLTSLNKKPKGTVIILVIPTTLAIVLVNNLKVLLLSSLYRSDLQQS